ncbi:hypothetical protein [Trueperella bialowiezensis]|uniref:Uncharacterized protein n=1 Tax=Trueperella bialowiezensis TaxID=312285 RepID=A0A3S4V954_9ACTO|nr:hypothetical protein [Trueperella bialowiezensis]VEI12328.1 Uncharacterised protein [Trueperella bialowiezensis]
MARHLVYAGELIHIDPEAAYTHARAAYKKAARIDIVREALGLTAYATERYSEALRELRTYRRMSDDYRHVPLEADAERGLGRPEKALRFIEGIPLKRLNAQSQVELALVTSGARAETGDSEGGLSVLEKILVDNLPKELAARVQLIKADRLDELGRSEEATQLREEWQDYYEDQGEDMMVDLDDVLDDLPEETGAFDVPDDDDVVITAEDEAALPELDEQELANELEEDLDLDLNEQDDVDEPAAENVDDSRAEDIEESDTNDSEPVTDEPVDQQEGADTVDTDDAAGEPAAHPAELDDLDAELGDDFDTDEEK